MASQTCWRCLSRPVPNSNGLYTASSRAAVLTSTVLPFSTSTPRPGTFKLKKKKREKTAKPPAPGERRALRDMIVLSNTNALAIPNGEEMSADNVSSAQYRGRVVAIPDDIVSRLRAAETFQTKQRWKMFRRPSIVLRSSDVRLAQMMDDVKSSKRVIRQVLVGERGAGKSLYLLQAAASAMLKNWLVITIPEGQDLVNAHTEYSPIPNIRPTMYQQKIYTAALLNRIVSANPQLADLKMTLEHQLSISIPDKIALSQLALLGVNDPALAQPIFETLMKELTAPGRPPLLITLDGYNHINKISAYRNASFQLIHAYDIYLPSWFNNHLSGKSALPNGGAVLAAMTRSNGPHVRTLDDRIEQLEKQQAVLNGLQLRAEDNIILPFLKATGQEALATQVPELDAFVRYDTRVLDTFAQTQASPALSAPEKSSEPVQAPTSSSDNTQVSSWASLTPANSNIEIKRFSGLTKIEAKALMEYWALSGILRAEVSERFVGEQWSVAGGGLPGELERTCLGMRY